MINHKQINTNQIAKNHNIIIINIKRKKRISQNIINPKHINAPNKDAIKNSKSLMK